MKKFLSLVLALVMTMSLVTISAGAAEYDELTDKDEIQYEEAVAVLNRIGIITGYSDGSFQPTKELTRGAAAKIIVSLMIGSEAASNLVATSAPYSDVPVDHTFAGVIGFCKTSGYINGYQDGTFRPNGTLSGYAFAKMLLGALGYKGENEGGFTGAGWTMNVARLGNAAGLFDRLTFKGNDTVNREQACQLALNTIKGTLVEYTGGMNVSNGEQSVVVNPTRTYVTSNQEFATHISNRKAGVEQGNAVDNHYTVEFGEEHFVDLRMDADRNADDDFGRPSNKWSYKKVTIGTYPVEADFTFDHQIAHREESDAIRKRATGLSDYTLVKTVAGEGTYRAKLWINGRDCGNAITEIEDIADLTDNGAIVEVYVSDTIADWIQDVVVVQTQLMEVKRIGKDYVSLQMEDNKKADSAVAKTGYNVPALDVSVQDVQEEDGTYKLLSGLKAGDLVAVVPVAINHGDTYDVFEAYVPETVSGSLTNVANYGSATTDTNAIALTVGGTEYKIAQWNRDMMDLTAQKIKVTKKDVTLYLDKAGCALKADDIGATDDWMIIGNFRQTLENGRLVNIINGWDISGTELSLNVGPTDPAADLKPGDLVHYQSTSSNIAEWSVDQNSVFPIYADTDANTGNGYMIKTSNDKVALKGYDNTTDVNAKPVANAAKNDTEYFDKGVKFIYVTFNTDHEVESVSVKKTVQEVKNSELLATEQGAVANAATDIQKNNYDRAQAAVKLKTNGESVVKAVVIKSEANDAIATNMLYVKDWHGGAGYDADGKMIYKYTVAMNSADGVHEEVIYSDKELYRGDFASYTESENGTFSPFYKLNNQNNQIGRTTSTFIAEIDDDATAALRIKNKNLVSLKNYKKMDGTTGFAGTSSDPAPVISSSDVDTLGLGTGGNRHTISLRNAEWVDLVTPNDRINSVDELAKYKNVKVALVVNDNEKNDGFRQVSMIVVLRGTEKTDDAAAPVVEMQVDVVAPGGALPGAPSGVGLGSMQVGGKLVLTAVVKNASACGDLTYTWYHNGSVYVPEKTGVGTGYDRLVLDITTANMADLNGSWTVRVVNTDNTKEDGKVSAPVSPSKVTDSAGNELTVSEGANASENASAFVIGGEDGPVVTDPSKTTFKLVLGTGVRGVTVLDNQVVRVSGDITTTAFTTVVKNAVLEAGYDKVTVTKKAAGSNTTTNITYTNGDAGVSNGTTDAIDINTGDTITVTAGYTDKNLSVVDSSWDNLTVTVDGSAFGTPGTAAAKPVGATVKVTLTQKAAAAIAENAVATLTMTGADASKPAPTATWTAKTAYAAATIEAFTPTGADAAAKNKSLQDAVKALTGGKVIYQFDAAQTSVPADPTTNGTAMTDSSTVTDGKFYYTYTPATKAVVEVTFTMPNYACAITGIAIAAD